MSDKYIIRNCPAFVLMRTATSGTYFDMCGNAKGHIKCADCTDCKLKQIVEKCKLFQNNYLVNDGVQLLTTNILNSLDIQEVE